MTLFVGINFHSASCTALVSAVIKRFGRACIKLTVWLGRFSLERLAEHRSMAQCAAQHRVERSKGFFFLYILLCHAMLRFLISKNAGKK